MKKYTTVVEFLAIMMALLSFFSSGVVFWLTASLAVVGLIYVLVAYFMNRKVS